MGTPTYKLYYFNFQAWGEAARLVFAQARVDYKGIRFTQEEWKDEYKKQSPFSLCTMKAHLSHYGTCACPSCFITTRHSLVSRYR